MTGKAEQVKRTIQGKGEGYKLTGLNVTIVAMECEVSESTVYRVVRNMQRAGLVNKEREYTGRQHIPASELAKIMKCETILTDSKYNELAREFFTSPLVVMRSVNAAIRVGALVEMNGGMYGYMVRTAS